MNDGWTNYSNGEAYAGYQNGTYYVSLIKFTAPVFEQGNVPKNIEFSMWLAGNTQFSTRLRYAVCSSDANKALYTNTHSAVTDANQIASGNGGFTIPAAGNKQFTKITINTNKIESGKTYYLFLWAYDTTSSPSSIVVVQGAQYHDSITVNFGQTYKLTTSADTGCNITVERTQSYGGSTGVISSGTDLYEGDTLKITFIADDNYRISSGAVNGVSFTSGATHIVSGDVSVTATATPLSAVVSATDANVGSASIITIISGSATYKYTLTYQFKTASGTIASMTGSTSIPWTVPTSFYSLLGSDTFGECTITCKTYDGGTLVGSTTCTMTIMVSASMNYPDVSGTVIDVNEKTVSLTGDPSIMVRYLSTAKCTIDAVAKNGASISFKQVNGVELVSENSVELENVERDFFIFYAKDSRGYERSAVVKTLMIQYIKPTIHPTVTRGDSTTGEVLMSFKGSYFNGGFGRYNNTITIKYHYRKQSEPEYSEWITIDPSMYYVAENAYRTIQPISLGAEFDYKASYRFEVLVCDGANGVILSEDVGVASLNPGKPIFDWGENDFNFNVPIKLNGKVLFDIIYPIGSVYLFYSRDGEVYIPPDEITEMGSWNNFDTGIENVYGWRRIG